MPKLGAILAVAALSGCASSAGLPAHNEQPRAISVKPGSWKILPGVGVLLTSPVTGRTMVCVLPIAIACDYVGMDL